ncbi:YihY family inner membrane protein [Moraxella oblonga]|uniref:YihY family inner membrane protein n=1 Tax=Moraxella oblonga TaxID=200413 RepID=UPI00147023CD|nr:YihY family inner membrane protein [Moraxella oblonga]
MQKFINKLPFAKSAWFLYLCFLARHYWGDDCTQKASSLTYTTLLSLVPIITVILVLFSVVPALAEMREHVQEMIYKNLLPSSSQNVQNYLDSFAQKSSNLGLFGIIGVFVTTIMTLLTIENAFNQIWRVSERSGGLSSLIRYWTMITLTPAILGVAFGASSAIRGLSFLNQRFMGYGIDWAVWTQIISLLVMTAGFIGMYWFIPKTHVPLKNATIAGVVTAILFELLKKIFGVVMSNFTSYEAIYGAFAIIPVFLMWLYLSWNVILLGVEISYTLTIFDKTDAPKRPPLLNLLQMIHLAYCRHGQGQSVSENEIRNLLDQRDKTHWHSYLDKLMEHKLITRTTDGDYVLRMDLESVSVWQLYQKLPYPLPTQAQIKQYQHRHDDVWLDKLSQKLALAESHAQSELDLSLAELFKDIPSHEEANQADNLPPTHQIQSDDMTTHTTLPTKGVLAKTAFYVKNPKLWFKKYKK